MYFRLFSSILDSSLMQSGVEARWLFVTMLIIADEAKTGVVDMPLAALARRSAMTVPQVEQALAELMAPDPDSASGEEEGRRIQPIDKSRPTRGWVIVNWEKYKLIANSEAQREAVRRRVAAYRGRKRVTAGNASVTKSNPSKAKAEAKGKAKAPLSAAGGTPPKGFAKRLSSAPVPQDLAVWPFAPAVPGLGSETDSEPGPLWRQVLSRISAHGTAESRRWLGCIIEVEETDRQLTVTGPDEAVKILKAPEARAAANAALAELRPKCQIEFVVQRRPASASTPNEPAPVPRVEDDSARVRSRRLSDV